MQKVTAVMCLCEALFVLLSACNARPAFDPVAQDVALISQDFPPRVETVTIESGGAQMNGRLYVAPGKGPRPTVLVARGFPDYMGNLDVMMALQRAGVSVLSFNYRGFWGSEGSFTLTSALADVKEAIRYLRTEKTTRELRVDPAHIILLGYSLGGPIMLKAAAEDPGIRAVALIECTDLRSEFAAIDTPEGYKRAIVEFESTGGVHVDSRSAIVDDYISHLSEWNPATTIPGLTGKSVLLLYASDGNGTFDIKPSLPDLLRNQVHLTAATLKTDHTFAGRRVALTRAVLSWVQGSGVIEGEGAGP